MENYSKFNLDILETGNFMFNCAAMVGQCGNVCYTGLILSRVLSRNCWKQEYQDFSMVDIVRYCRD